MNVDPKYLSTLLEPLENENILTLQEYLVILKGMGVKLQEPNCKVDDKFDFHFRYMSARKLISSLDGKCDLDSLGYLSASSYAELVYQGDKTIMKAVKEEPSSNNTFTFNGPVTNQHAQFGNNTQTVTINIQELVEQVAESGDKEAKGMLMKLLENPTISGLVGGSASALIGLLENI
ncbi:hypothetical protein DFP75_103220 [Marinomonas alcarazii]|uniref:Uncharacterized protein n=1 Tax=Marinomonas alcarazii TaxID=491949 RepID=A0A318V0W5_9GAMM|nr:hypothetical protein [Marinomonas alcarazii]PYF82392.1 hypothetical protein DFP75_103220 [Marinomonas alcarazii]